MTIDERDYIPVDEHLRKFHQYLESSTRCILSARFGDGKSYFIDRFMGTYKDEYLFIPIFPVNYQVADNKDIFEYIKRDILVYLIVAEGVTIGNEDIKKSWLLYYYLTQNNDAALDFLSFLPQINLGFFRIDPGKIVNKIKEFQKRFDSYAESYASDIKKKNGFEKTFVAKAGSIVEFDRISQLICDIINRHKEENKNKKVVLVIEDLDRIDPAHIFRILNVFSAHFERYNRCDKEKEKTQGENKFNFDKIITVCHYDNIREIYKHCYGEHTDFNGYIDKFSDMFPFHYSLRENLRLYIINNLDSDLREKMEICDNVSGMIIDRYLDRTNPDGMYGNLRMFNANLAGYRDQIKNEKIEIDLNDGKTKIYIESKNCFTSLLSLMILFKLNFNELIDGIRSEKFILKELCTMVGVCWLVLNTKKESPKIIFEKINRKSSVSYICNGIKVPCSYTKSGRIVTYLDLAGVVDNGDEQISPMIDEIEYITDFFIPYLHIPVEHDILFGKKLNGSK